MSGLRTNPTEPDPTTALRSLYAFLLPVGRHRSRLARHFQPPQKWRSSGGTGRWWRRRSPSGSRSSSASPTTSTLALAPRSPLPLPVSVDVSSPLSLAFVKFYNLNSECTNDQFLIVSAVAEGYWLKQSSMSPYSGSSQFLGLLFLIFEMFIFEKLFPSFMKNK